MAMSEPSKTGEVGVHRHQLATVLDGESGVIRIGHQLATRARRAAEAHEDLPARRSVREKASIRSASQPFDELEPSSIVVGSSQSFGSVTIRMNPLAPSSDSPKGSGPTATSLSHSA